MYSKKVWGLIKATYISSSLPVSPGSPISFDKNLRIPRVLSDSSRLYIHTGKSYKSYPPTAYGYAVREFLKNNGSKR